MMKKYLRDLFYGIIHGSVKKKILTVIFLFLYLSIILICVIPLPVSSTSPGTINRISTVIEFEDTLGEVSNKRIYSVAVYSKSKASILEYFIAKLDKNTEIEIDDRENNIYTIKEEDKIDVIAKEQSIQDSIIVAYNKAKDEGYDVSLPFTYKGIRVATVPVNYIGCGPESIQIGDIITEIDGIVLDSIDTFKEKVLNILSEYHENKDITVKGVKVLRDNSEVELASNNILTLCYLGAYVENYGDKMPEYIAYEYYDLKGELAKPSFKINKAYSSGPSAGLIQTLYVYDAITNGSVIKDKYILATGTISKNGKVGAIGGVSQKIMTANYYQCEYFFVPTSNYNVALEKYNTIKDPSYKLYEVNSFDDLINVLKGGED